MIFWPCKSPRAAFNGKMGLVKMSEWAVLLMALFQNCMSIDIAPTEISEPGSGESPPEEIDLLEQLWVVANSSNVTGVVENRCPVLQVGQYSTLSLPLHMVFGQRFADEFSLLLQLRSPQQVDRSLMTFLSPDNHILLQLRLSEHSLTFIATQQRHYEFPVSILSDGQWHRIALSVSEGRLGLYVDCAKVESVDWQSSGLDITTDGLLMVGGLVEAFETPFEGEVRQLVFLMGNADAAREQCELYPANCGGTVPKPPRSTKKLRSEENLLLSTNYLEDLLQTPDATNQNAAATGAFRRVGSTRGDGTVPSRHPTSVGRGDVFEVDEDTDLVDTVFLHAIPASNKTITQHIKGSPVEKPDSSSKLPDENITTDKRKTDSRRTDDSFPGKLVDIIDLDEKTQKKPPVIYPDGRDTGGNSGLDYSDSKPIDGDNEPPKHVQTPTPMSPVPTLQPTSCVPGEEGSKKPPGTVTYDAREGVLVTGLDGRTYRLHRGPRGRVGPPGEPGCPGAVGHPGYMGDKGALGPEGHMGRPGAPGAHGPPGLPTIYLWRNTEEDWADFRQSAFFQLLYSGWPRMQGPAGPQGQSGRPGVEGPPGDPGSQGSIGQSGYMGDPGPKGVSGRMGFHGKDGEDGLDGLPGPPGVPGPPGPRGYKGDPGLPGEKGDEGLMGLEGPIGDEGNPGEKGNKGATGLPGLAGPSGDRGNRGLEGLEGTSGTEGEEGLEGQSGPPGYPGPSGFTGLVGAQGANGSQGDVGPSGVIGVQGLKGPEGLEGPMGAPGPRGVQGLPGKEGPPGPKGERGLNGPIGSRGETGFEG
uniref:Laminin G domain-containing protein n=2 Tax=Denticeps clupeoides TaxID=299321 RepID=A0AAY4CW64_9TELE